MTAHAVVLDAITMAKATVTDDQEAIRICLDNGDNREQAHAAVSLTVWAVLRLFGNDADAVSAYLDDLHREFLTMEGVDE